MGATIKKALVAAVAMMLTVGTATVAQAAVPTITSFNPVCGPAGTTVTITGKDFTSSGAANSVKFGSTPAVFSVASDTQITTSVPAGASSGVITVGTPGGTISSAGSFTVTSARPTLTSFNPTTSSAGTTVTIAGCGFSGATSVKFNVTSAVYTVNSDTQITTSVPVGATTGKITVATPLGTVQSSSSFTVPSGAVPTITSFSPTSGAAGTSVTINGTNFTGAQVVTFNGVGASFAVATSVKITATVPSGASTGKITVTTPSGTATSSGTFTMSGAKITSFSPTSGPSGTNVTINGSNLTGTTSVTFNGVAATFSVQNSGRITAVVPAGATTGKIAVNTPAGGATSSGNFTITGPSITSFSPSSGTAGTGVTIYGSNFTNVSSVRFNGIGAGFSVSNSGRITTTVPAGAMSGRITVTASGGTATSATSFTVTVSAHERIVTLDLSGHLYATGRVNANDGYLACSSQVPVVIKHLHHGEWRWMTTTSTGSDGTYRAYVRDRKGQYRANAKKITLANGAVCGGDRSSSVAHRG